MKYIELVVCVLAGFLASLLFKIGTPLWVVVVGFSVVLFLLMFLKKVSGKNIRQGVILFILFLMTFSLLSALMMPDDQAGYLKTFIIFLFTSIVFSVPVLLFYFLINSFLLKKKLT